MSNVLILCDTFAPRFGGSETMLLDLARGLANRRHNVTVLAPDSPGASQFDRTERYNIVRSRLWAKLFRLGRSGNKTVNRLSRLMILPLVLRHARRVANADVLVIGHVLPLGTAAAILKKTRPQLRTIIMTYGEDVSVYSRGPRMRNLLISALNAADAITCLTSDSAAELANLDITCQPRLKIVPPAVEELGPVNPAEVESLRTRFALAGKRVILTLSRLAPRKGIDITLHAIHKLQSEIPNLAYLVAGTGPDVERLKAIVQQLDLKDYVTFTGAVPAFACAAALCEVFCMPNRQMPDGEREGFGIVFLEAGLAGKPVIAGRSGGATDAVVDGVTGLLVDPESADDVAAALRRLLLDQGFAAKLGQQGRERALRNYSVENFVTAYEELFK